MLQKITFFKEERCYNDEKTFQKIVALALANHYKYKKVRILLSISSPSLIIEKYAIYRVEEDTAGGVCQEEL